MLNRKMIACVCEDYCMKSFRFQEGITNKTPVTLVNINTAGVTDVS